MGLTANTTGLDRRMAAVIDTLPDSLHDRCEWIRRRAHTAVPGAAMSASHDNDPPTLSLVPSPETAPTTSDLIDEPTLATRLGVSRSTLQSWRYTGRGPRFIKLGRMIRYRNVDIDAYLRANTRGRVA